MATKCLDPETLAAWADDGLDAERVRAIEAHVSSCERCQAMVAAFYASSEAGEHAPATAAPAAVIPFRRNRLVYVLPIAGTIAATLLIWLGGPWNQRARTPESTISQAELPASPLAAARPAPTPPIEPPAPAAAQRGLAKQEARQDQRILRSERSAAATPVKPSAAPTAQASGAVVAPPPPATYVAPPPPPVIPPPAAVGVATQSSAVSSALRESVMARAEPPKVVASFSSNDPRAIPPAGIPGGIGQGQQLAVGAGRGGGGGGGRGGRGGAAGGSANAAADAIAPLPAYWRIMASDVVEKSTDNLAWTPVTIDPKPVGLTSGSAPSPAVCWLAGRGGLVLLSTDGRTFARVSLPSDANIEAISSTSALQAWVRTTDGRTFMTTDAGKTWR